MIDGAVAYGLLIPFAGTSLGAAMVFLLRRDMSARVRKLLLGFASGVMMAASVWSLLIPSIDMTVEQGGTGWLPATVGFLAGMFSLLLFDTLVPQYIVGIVYATMVQAYASEQSARMNAMDSANRNGREMLDNYTSELNTARQSAVTSEIAEIIGALDVIGGEEQGV